MPITLSDLVSMFKIQKNSYFQMRLERLIYIHMKEVHAFPAKGRLLKSKFTVTMGKKKELNRQSNNTFSILGFSLKAKCWVHVLTID